MGRKKVVMDGKKFSWVETKLSCDTYGPPYFRASLNTGVNVIKVLHLYFTRVAIVSLSENNSCTCKLQV